MTTQHRVAFQRITLAAVAAAAAARCAPAQAVDWGGYFRAGPGATKKDASRACYGLNGPGLKYRLGNECDIYGEFLLSQGFKADGVEYTANLMTNLWNPGTDTGDAKVGINQMYVEGKGYDIAPNASFWIGKRFYGRADVHTVDTFYVNLSGVGAGADNVVNLVDRESSTSRSSVPTVVPPSRGRASTWTRMTSRSIRVASCALRAPSPTATFPAARAARA
jgi:maltoporin